MRFRFSGKTEVFLFYICVLLSMVPVLLPGHFVTLDGPAHLYNSRLIRELLLGNELVDRFFTFNTRPEPNWSGHFLMALAGSILPSMAVMKLLLCLIIFLTASGFRQLVLKTEPANFRMSWLIFPWLCSFPFMLGFLNYSLGFAILPWILFQWIKDMEKPTDSRFIILLIFFLFAWFSHLMIFAVTVIAITFLSLMSENKVYRIKRMMLLSLPFVAAGILFINSKGTGGMELYDDKLPVKELFLYFATARPLIIYDFSKEQTAGIAYAIFLFIILIYSIKRKKENKYFVAVSLFAFTMAVLHFLFPNTYAAGGLITIRLTQLTFLAVLWLVSLSDIPVLFQKLTAFISIFFSLTFFNLHHTTARQLSKQAMTYQEAARKIPDDSVVLPLNYSENWLHANFSGFAGAERNLLILDNYEADMGYFPLHWKGFTNATERYGNFTVSSSPCIPFERLAALHQLPDAVIKWQKNETHHDSCDLDTERGLNQYYKLTYSNSDAGVYLLK